MTGVIPFLQTFVLLVKERQNIFSATKGRQLISTADLVVLRLLVVEVLVEFQCSTDMLSYLEVGDRAEPSLRALLFIRVLDELF